VTPLTFFVAFAREEGEKTTEGFKETETKGKNVESKIQRSGWSNLFKSSIAWLLMLALWLSVKKYFLCNNVHKGRS